MTAADIIKKLFIVNVKRKLSFRRSGATEKSLFQQ